MDEIQSCSNCEYFLRLVTGNVCNGLKEPTVDPCQSNDCTNWEQLNIGARALRDRELQERVERPERINAGTAFLRSTQWSDHIPSDVQQQMREAVVQNIERLPQMLQQRWSSAEHLTPEFWHEVHRYIPVPGWDYWGTYGARAEQIILDDPYSPRISEEQIARVRDWAGELINRREQVQFWQGVDLARESDRTGYEVRLRQEEERIFRDRYENQYEARPLPRTEVPRSRYPTVTATQLQEVVRHLPDPERAAIDRVRTYCCDRYFYNGLEENFNTRIERERLVFELKQICYRAHCFHRWVYQGEVIME